MKNKTCGILAVLLLAAVLTACGGGKTAPAATGDPVYASYPDAADTETAQEPVITPEPPSTKPDPTPVPEKNGMYDLLCGLMDGYHAGTAGSSLTSAWYAASIVDWARKNPGAETSAGVGAWDRPMDNEYGEKLRDKLDAVYAQALMLTASDKGLLDDCGYAGPWDYTSREVRSTFQTIYTGLGLPAPFLVLVWSPGDNAEGFMITAEEVPEISPAGLNAAMADKVLLGGSAIASWEDSNGDFRVDMNADFGAQIRSMGTAGEYLYMGGLVNTLLDAWGAESLTLTVEGNVLETGHEIYDYPLTFYEENR